MDANHRQCSGRRWSGPGPKVRYDGLGWWRGWGESHAHRGVRIDQEEALPRCAARRRATRGEARGVPLGS